VFSLVEHALSGQVLGINRTKMAASQWAYPFVRYFGTRIKDISSKLQIQYVFPQTMAFNFGIMRTLNETVPYFQIVTFEIQQHRHGKYSFYTEIQQRQKCM
jgi:hypothetical protein